MSTRWKYWASLIVALVLAVTATFIYRSRQRVVESRARFDPIDRASVSIRTATSVGVNYIEYQRLVQNFATEAAVLHQRPLRRGEAALWRLYSDELATYTDALTVWRQEADSAATQLRAKDRLAGDEIIPNHQVFLVLQKYNISIEPSGK